MTAPFGETMPRKAKWSESTTDYSPPPKPPKWSFPPTVCPSGQSSPMFATPMHGSFLRICKKKFGHKTTFFQYALVIGILFICLNTYAVWFIPSGGGEGGGIQSVTHGSRIGSPSHPTHPSAHFPVRRSASAAIRKVSDPQTEHRKVPHAGDTRAKINAIIVKHNVKLVSGKLRFNTFPRIDVHDGDATPNEVLRNAAMAITTRRQGADCLLSTIRALRRGYTHKDLQIFVADDGPEGSVNPANMTAAPYNVAYVKMPPGVGAARGRNCLVDIISALGYQYVVMADDDYELEDYAGLYDMGRLMIDTGADLISPAVCDERKRCELSLGTILMGNEGALTIYPNRTRSGELRTQSACHQSDLFPPFFLGELSQISQLVWDPALEDDDAHLDFQIRVKRAGLKVLTCPKAVKLLHKTISCSHRETWEVKGDTKNKLPLIYNLESSLKKDNGTKYLIDVTASSVSQTFFQKWKLTRFYDALGRRYSFLNSQNSRQNSNHSSPNVRMVVSQPEKTQLLSGTKSQTYTFIVNTIVRYINDCEPPHRLVKGLVENSQNPLTITKLNEALILVRGSQKFLTVHELSGLANAAQKRIISLPYDFVKFNRSSPDASHFLSLYKAGQYTSVESEAVPRLYVIVVVRNGDRFLLDAYLSAMESTSEESLPNVFCIIVDATETGEISNVPGMSNRKIHLKSGRLSVVRYVPVLSEGQIRRKLPTDNSDIGPIRKGLNYALQLSTALGIDGEALAFLADVAYPPTRGSAEQFFTTARRSSRCGASVFLPVGVMKNKENKLLGRDYSRSMLGVCLADYRTVLTANPSLLSAERTDLSHFLSLVLDHVPYAVHTEEPNLVKVVGAKETTSLSAHFEPLPFTYVVDETFANVLQEWLERRLGSKVTLTQAYETNLVSRQATIFDLRYVNAEEAETYAIIEASFL